MCSAITHSLVGLAIARVGTSARMPARYWVAAALLAAAPDLDAIGYSLGLGPPGGSIWSHRGLTHSLPFAVVVAGVGTLALFSHRIAESTRGVAMANLGWGSPIPRWQVWLIFAVAMASHGLSDMATNGGAGIALFSPATAWRSKWAFTPVEVSPLSIGAFFSEWGVRVLWSELRWVLLPVGVVVAAVELVRACTTVKPAR
jgi:inner membrane protein